MLSRVDKFLSPLRICSNMCPCILLWKWLTTYTSSGSARSAHCSEVMARDGSPSWWSWCKPRRSHAHFTLKPNRFWVRFCVLGDYTVISNIKGHNVLFCYMALIGKHGIVRITQCRWSCSSLVTPGWLCTWNDIAEKTAYRTMAIVTCEMSLDDLKSKHFVGIVNLTVIPSPTCPNDCKQRQTSPKRHCYCLSIDIVYDISISKPTEKKQTAQIYGQ